MEFNTVYELLSQASSTRRCVCCGELTESCCFNYEAKECLYRLHIFCGNHSDLWLAENRTPLSSFLEKYSISSLSVPLSTIDGDF